MLRLAIKSCYNIYLLRRWRRLLLHVWGAVIVVAAVRWWFYILFYCCCAFDAIPTHCAWRLLNRKCQSLMNWKLVLQIKYPYAYSISRWFFALLESVRLNLYCRVFSHRCICWGFWSMCVCLRLSVYRAFRIYAKGVFSVCYETVLLGFHF